MTWPLPIWRKTPLKLPTDDDTDAVVIGEPSRVVRVTGRKAEERQGEPLIVPDDGLSWPETGERIERHEQVR